MELSGFEKTPDPGGLKIPRHPVFKADYSFLGLGEEVFAEASFRTLEFTQRKSLTERSI